jgi:hypothetical protein
MLYNMMISSDIYDRFTMEYFPLRQGMTFSAILLQNLAILLLNIIDFA